MRLLSDNQQQAVEKLRRLKVGALFMGCGTGKTQTAVSLINSVDDVDSVLWVCPLRTADNLRAELALCDPQHPVRIVGVESIGQSDRIFLEVLNSVNDRTFVVVDESIKIKNLKAKRTKRLLEIGEKVQYKLILNGTPVTKNILDIYAQMLFLSPKILQKNFYRFCADYCVVKEQRQYGHTVKRWIVGFTNTDHLLSLIEPYVYECSLDLSLAKRYAVHRWSMTNEERDAYESLKDELFATLRDEHSPELLGVFQKLQHSYCLAKEKIALLNGLVDDRTIIYCKFIRAREHIQQAYPNAKVLTYGKNSFGLNLQKYRRIVYFDKTFDYAHREQSEARIYRMGQENDCEYIDFTGDVGLEKLFDKCIEKKLSLIDAFKLSGLNLKGL